MPQFPKVALRSQSKLLVAAACTFMVPLLMACIQSDAPLSDRAYNDPAVVGSWVAKENPVELNVGAPDANGVYNVVETSIENDGTKTTRYQVRLTKGAERTYANLIEGNKYQFFQYFVKDNQLHLKAMNFNTLKTAIEAGRIKGDFKEGGMGQQMNLRDTSERLFALVESPDGANFFENEIVYDRKTPDADLIKAVLQSQADAWNKGDLNAFMSAYLKSPDVTYVSADGEVHGYDALLQRYQNRYGTKPETMGKLSFSNLQVQPLGLRNAMAVGNWRVAREGQPELNGIFTLVLAKTPEGWKLIHDHTSVLSADVQKK